MFCNLGNFFKPLATLNLPKSLTFFGNFCKGIKIYHFSSEIIFGQLLQTFDDFYLVTLISAEIKKFLSLYFLSRSTVENADCCISLNRCDQIGRFWKVFGNKIYCKRSPNDWQLSGQFWKTSLLCKSCIVYFLGIFWGKLGFFLLDSKWTSVSSAAMLLYTKGLSTSRTSLQ